MPYTGELSPPRWFERVVHSAGKNQDSLPMLAHTSRSVLTFVHDRHYHPRASPRLLIRKRPNCLVGMIYFAFLSFPGERERINTRAIPDLIGCAHNGESHPLRNFTPRYFQRVATARALTLDVPRRELLVRRLATIGPNISEVSSFVSASPFPRSQSHRLNRGNNAETLLRICGRMQRSPACVSGGTFYRNLAPKARRWNGTRRLLFFSPFFLFVEH